MDKKNTPCWSSCPDCQGQGKKSQRLRKKVRLQYQQLVAKLTAAGEVALPEAPKAPLVSCSLCGGSGLISSKAFPMVDAENYPHISIIGGGIGGVALAVACLHRGIPFTLFERDTHFEARSQGYGLTLQQASKAIEGFGIFSLTEGVVSTRHLVHKTDGTVVGEWGMRKWVQPTEKKYTKRSNIHIARQALRLALVEQLGGKDNIQWRHQLLDFQEEASGKIQLRFQVGEQIKIIPTDLLVGADGIRSVVRQQLIGEEVTPLRYLGCLVILGICPLDALPTVTSELLDSATVFQTANGHERIYIMPFTEDSVMWQLSFPMEEAEAYEMLMKNLKLTQVELAEQLGKSRPYIANYLRLLTLPQIVKDLVQKEQLSMGQARTLLGLKDEKDIIPLANRVLKEGLTVRQLEQIVSDMNDKQLKTPKKTKQAAPKPYYIQTSEDRLMDKFGTNLLQNCSIFLSLIFILACEIT